MIPQMLLSMKLNTLLAGDPVQSIPHTGIYMAKPGDLPPPNKTGNGKEVGWLRSLNLVNSLVELDAAACYFVV